MFAPDSVSVPVPILARDSVPRVSVITPEKVLVALLPPTDNVGDPPDRVSTLPVPLRPLIVSLLPFRSSVPATLTLPLPAPSGITPAAPSLSMPPTLTVVSPL